MLDDCLENQNRIEAKLDAIIVEQSDNATPNGAAF